METQPLRSQTVTYLCCTAVVMVAVAVFSPAPARGQQIDLAAVYPTMGTDSIPNGHEITFEFDWNNSGSTTITGWTCGFKFWLTGGTRSPVDVDSALYVWVANHCALQRWGQRVDRFGTDGIAEDTIGLAAWGGMFHTSAVCDMAHFFVTINEDAIGHQFCIDSCWYPPSYSFIWRDDTGWVPVGWEGPHCFTVVNCCRGYRGNVNGDPDDLFNIVDLTYLVSYLFAGGPPPPCSVEADVDGDERVNIGDLSRVVLELFGGEDDRWPPLECP